ncbi:hypothetical protein SDC9_47551 [bioreactor metagenome]|jgi:hypothetical protein|uniref:Uncharacterized protein n=1 Tax=bioreactor metagenome TaxID=1076179 RepID=A0A644WC42_9ZZZZ
MKTVLKNGKKTMLATEFSAKKGQKRIRGLKKTGLFRHRDQPAAVPDAAHHLHALQCASRSNLSARGPETWKYLSQRFDGGHVDVHLAASQG